MRKNEESYLRRRILAMFERDYGIKDIAWALNTTRQHVRTEIMKHARKEESEKLLRRLRG